MMLEGKIALITGGASGIGRATALAFAAEGAKVAVADVDVDGGGDTAQMINDDGGEAIFIQCDVSDEASVEAMVNQTVEHFGGLDCAFNNAGIEGTPGPLQTTTEADWSRVIAINLSGVFYCLKHEMAYMMENGGGVIVNTSSVAGLGGAAMIAPYVASKHGVAGLTKTAALEGAEHGIRVNSIHPGAIDTPMIARFAGEDAPAEMADMHPLGRVGQPAEVADMVVWLCSERSTFVTGHQFAIDGGMMAGY